MATYNHIAGKFIYILSGIFVIMFLLFLGMVSYHVRPVSDDLWFYYSLIEHGWFNSLVLFDFNTRWTSYLMFNTIGLTATDFSVLHKSFFIYYLISFALLLWGLMRFNKLFFFRLLKWKLNFWERFIISGLIMAGLYFTTLYALEVWFWVVASTTYLWPLIFLFFGASEFLTHGTHKSYVIIFLTFFLLGGTLENLVLVVFVMLLLWGSYSLFIERRFVKKIWLAAISVAILPIIVLLGQGAEKRFALERAVYDRLVDFSQLFIDGIQFFNLPRWFIFLLIWFIISFVVYNAKNRIIFPELNLRKAFLVNVILLLVVLFCTYLPLIIVFGNLGPARASAPVGYFLCLSFCFWAIIWGAKGSLMKIIIPAIGGSVFMLLMLSYLFYSQYHYTSRYAKAYDERIAFIKSDAHCNEEFIFVPELPDPGVIAGHEASRIDDPTYSHATLLLGKLNGVDKLVFLEEE